MPLANSVAACASLGIELRVVGSEHNMPTQTIAKTTLGGVKRLLMAIAYRRLQHVVCVSDDVCRDVERWYRYPPAKLSTIYNPVDFAGMTALSSENSSYVDWRSRNPETYLVLVVGALKAAKNHEFALRVISGMKPCFKIVFVGDGPLQEELTILSGQLDVLDRVEFAGSTANPYGWMKHADVLLVPSLYEGFGLVIVEAAFLGTPVITSDRYGVREISRRAGQTVLPLELDRFRRSIEEVVSMTESIDFNPRAYQPDKVAGIYRRILDGES
jgi:N-acetylgalactosamine-N,N'-diacetylbacillosaminyl-diphospho-undecaprenol 4-alpha-N-acetylgalactosaminyltransferase